MTVDSIRDLGRGATERVRLDSAQARPGGTRVTSDKLLVVGIGGTTRAGSGTERALALALRSCSERGAATISLGGEFLAALPHYRPGAGLTEVQQGLLEVVARADAVILATPGYHGGISGLLKNALDTLEELRDGARPYLDGRAVGCVVTAYGWQAGGTVLTGLRATVHALRGWPTPYGAVVNTLETPLDGRPLPAEVAQGLERVGQQVVRFAAAFADARGAEAAGELARAVGA
ncbi:MAG: NAD(P)H-dependent oxidoreductase [Pseudoxanthomonas sp.]